MVVMKNDSNVPPRTPPYGLRIPPDLKARIKAAALDSGRSMNAEIVHTLEKTYPVPVNFELQERFFQQVLDNARVLYKESNIAGLDAFKHRLVQIISEVSEAEENMGVSPDKESPPARERAGGLARAMLQREAVSRELKNGS